MEDEKKEEELETTNETEKVETETTEENQEGNSESRDEESNEATSKEPEKKLFTQEQLDSMFAERARRENNTSKRREASIRQEYEEKLARAENIINAGFGTKSLDEGLSRISEICKTKGIDIPEPKTKYSNSDLEVLANHAAEEIIADGYDAVDSELNRLANKGVDKMTPRDKLIFSKLNDNKKMLDNVRELTKIGVRKETLESKEFKDFANKFTGSKFTPTEVYKMFTSVNQTKTKAKPIGSMINNNPKEEKTFISQADYDKMSDKEIAENMELIRKSMLKW